MAPKAHQVQGMELLLKEEGVAANWNTNKTTYLFLLCNVILHIRIPQNFYVTAYEHYVTAYEHLKLCLKTYSSYFLKCILLKIKIIIFNFFISMHQNDLKT
jgi:hypothetical protein